MLFNDIYYCQFILIYHILSEITIFFYINSEQEVFFWGGGSARKNAGARMRQPAVDVVSVLLFGLFRQSVAADGRKGFFAEVVLDFAGVLLGHGGIHPEAD